MRTYSAKPGEVEKHWYIIDAAGIPLGRSASKIATILMGKHKPEYTPHEDVGDYVIVINAAKILLTGNKMEQKMYHHHTGWMGHLKSKSAREVLKNKSDELFKHAVKGMLPKNKLGRARLSKLKVFAGPAPEHEFAAQKAKSLNLFD